MMTIREAFGRNFTEIEGGLVMEEREGQCTKHENSTARETDEIQDSSE